MPDATTSVREDIVARLVAVLQTGVPACTFERNRVDGVAADELPAATVYALTDRAERYGEQSIDPMRTPAARLPDVLVHTLEVRAEIHVKGVPPVDALVDPIYLGVARALHADATLQGLIRGLYVAQLQFETEASCEDRTVCWMDIRVVFATRATDPAVQINPVA